MEQHKAVERSTPTSTRFELPPQLGAADPKRTAALQEEIRALAAERKAVILAHNYQVPEVQDVADFVGDSLGLSLEAGHTDAERIIFCGVHFMAESAKVLNPDKRVFLPHIAAGCSLADSISPESLEDWMERYPGRAVVTYVNSSAEVKAMSDICCTSANAVSVVRSLDTDRILFTPDRNLGRWIAQQLPEKDIVVYDGACPTHDVLRGANVRRTRDANPDAVLIAHPECRQDILELADEICSTTAMVDRVANYPDARTFLVATENGMLHQLRKRYPDKEFILADGCIGCRLHCPYMKVTGLEDVRRSLLEEVHEIKVPAEVAAGARRALERMLAVPRD
ncbi:MAG TPA: quinolinate synthase NadA [bacterium]|nr:quinolinate synthase NadA [bacterium]